ncbi:PBECR2 nuclease fold domain-containing protein [Campylobacter upsaliensis]
MLDQSGAYLGADLLEKGLNKLGFKDENYIFESEKEDIKSRALKSVREKLERGDLEFNEREKHALRSKYDELDYKKALEKEKERLRLSQKSGNFNEAEREFIENDLGFFNTLFNDDKENVKEFKEKVKSEGVISSEIIKAANTLKAFDEGNLFKNMLFADEKEKKEFQQNFLNDAYKIAELSGFDDVGLDKKGELYFIKDEQKYLVNTGFFDNFAQLLNDTKFEFAGGVLGGMKGFNSGKSAKGKVAKSILGAAAGSFGGAFLDAKIADMYLNRESDFKKNLDFAIQAGLLSMAGDGVILSVKPLAKGLYKGVKKGGEILGEYSILGTLKTLPEQNIQAAEKIINEVFSPKMKEELKAAQEEFGGSVRGEDLKNAFFANLQKKFTQKYGENDSKTKSVAKIAEIFNTNSLKTRQQAMLDLVRSDTHGSTLAYLLEIAKDDVKIQSNLKNMLNLASSNVEKNLKNLNINAREIKHILDEFEAGNKAAFKEVESQISKLYDENYRVVLSKGEYENIKEEFRQNGVNLEEMTPFLRDLEANVFNENGVTFTQLNNFRKNLNFYIFNKDKTPNFINTLKKIGENILKNEIDKGIDNIFSQNKAAYESIKELYSTSLKDYATLKSLNESIKNLKLQDSAKSADEVLNSLIKYAKGQGEKGVNNLQKIKDYLGEENNAFLEMQILNKLFKESVVENDRASLRVFDSESFLGRVRELVGENELYERKIGKEFLEELSPSAMPKQISIDEFLNTLENFKNKENFLKHIEKDPKRKDYLNLIEPTLKEPDIAFKKLENGVEKEKFIKKFSDGKDFFYLLATKDNKETILTAFKTDKINTILKEFNTDIIPTFIRQGSKGKAAGTTNEGIITQPLFKSKEAREFLELVEGFHKLYKNDASIAKNLVQGTASQLSTSIATSAEGAIKQKVVKGGFDPIFRLLPDKILFGLFSKQIQGGALRYHLKKALSRSLNYDDFKIKLEKELKRTNFNSNTSRLIDEFMQNLDTFNAEKEAKLAKIREEQARIKEEERKRQEAIKTAQENAYNAQEANLGNDILEPSSLKEDFGENFAGYKGKEAIEKLLEEQRGQVKGAFYKEGLGEIDLVWGEITDLEKHKGYGLAHILDKRKSEFVEQGASESEAAQKAAEFAKNEISNIMQNGKIINKANEATRIETQDYRLILKQNWKGEPTKNKWLVTAYMKKEKGESISSSPFTKEDNLSLNSNESIAQNALSADEAISILQSVQAKQVPKELDIEGFLKELESVENKENFISHLSKKEDAKSRLAYLNLVKPTLEEADLILKTKNKNDEPTKEFIKAFQDENKRFFYIVITEQDNEKKLLTAFKTNKLRELKNRIEKARDFGEISFAHRFIKKSPTAENILKQKSLNLTEKLYLKDNDTPLNVEYKIVNKDDIKPSFTLSKTQFRSQKQEDLIKKIKENFNPDLLVNIRGDLKKGNPIITKEGEVISGNHRAAALKELEGENLAKYQNAVKEAFGVELKENEMLVRVADTSEAEIRRFSAASNEGLENNLGEQGVSLFAKYQDKIKALKEAKKPFVADDVYNLKYLVNKALGESSITKENDTSKALFASLARGRNNTILKALNELEKENLEQVSKVANMFFDNAGAFYNLTHDLDLPKMQNLQNYFSDVLVSAAKADFTRAEDFARLNEDIRAFLDSGDKNAMLKLSPNLVSDLLAKAMGAGFARFARLENPSASLYEFLNGLKAELIEKGMPDLFSGGKGIKLNERDEFDFAKELILKGQDSEEKFRLYQNLEELKAWSGEQKNTKLNTALKALDEVDESKLSEDQKELLRLFKGEIKSVKIQIKDLKDIYTLNQGSRKEGAKKILIKHYGEEKTGGLSSDELLSLKEVIKKGKINLNSLEIKDDFLRYGYDYEKDGVKLRVVIDEFKDGKKVFDYYSDRNFNHYEQGGYKPDLPTPSEIIPQNAKTSPYPQNADEAVRLETISKQELEQSNPQQSHLSTDESITQNSQEAKIKEAVKNHNAIYKEILDNDYIFTDERSKIFRKRERELIENLAKDEKVQAFTSQWGYPFKKDGELHGVGLDYKAKVYGKGKHKMMHVSGGGFGSATQQKKEKRLLELEKERLQEAFKADFGIDGFISKYVENEFFKTLWRETGAYKGTDYGWGVDPREYYPYYENRIMPSDTITQAKEKLQKEKSSWSVKRQEAKGSEDIIFTDKKGKEHTLTKETQKAWLEAFNLKSLEEAYTPNFKAEVKEAINRVLGGEEIKLTKGSFEKLIKEKRLKYLDRIKPTLENPHSVILQNDGALIFARDYGEEKYFTSVARNDSGEWIIRSNAPKSKNGLNNKILNGGKEIYNDQAASQINASNPYDDIANSNIKLDNESIAQNSHYLELVKEYGEENAKSIIKQKILGENIAQVLENEEEKFIYKKGDREFEFKIKDAMGQFEKQYDELNLKSDLNKSFLKALNKLKIGYEVLENEPVRIRYFKQEAKERKPKETKPSANKTLGQIQKDMRARLKELKAQAKENYERYKNEDKALQKELTNTKDLFKAFEKEFNETEGTILISRAKRRKNDAEGKVETSVFLGNELALRNALDRWERYSGYSEENALEVKERLELLRSYVKRLEKHREDIKAKREQLEQDYQQNEAARSKEMGVIGNYNILSNLKGVSENELYEPFLEKIHGFLSKADFYERHLPFAREEFQKLFNLTPLKEFGTNYAEFYRDGKGAVEKLLKEAEDFKQRGEKGEFKGQVSGAFYKEGLGEIDLVWGDSKKGLSHILERRTQDFINQGLEKGKAEYKVRELLSEIPQILENGKILSQNNDKIELITDKYTLVLGLREDKKFIVTELIDKRNKKRLEAMQTGVGDSFTDEPLAKTPLSQNQQEIIPQQKIKFAMEKFNYDEKKAKDLLEWHKNSHALTKDENGLPKVFYHGTYSKFRVFRRVGKASGQGFFFTPSQKATEEYGDITLNTFLNIKNPFRADELKINKEADLQKWADILKLDYDKEKYESFKDLKTKLEKVKEATKKAGFKFHSASGGGVYVIDNKGRNSFINLNELDKENKRVVEAFKGLETEDIYFYYVVRNEFDLVLYALNKNDRYFHTSGRDEVKRVLEKLGYDGVVLNDTIITVFNSNQIKHIDNKGSFTDTKGNVTSKKPKDKEAEFSYFNEKSDNIYHSNPHLGAGLVGGVLNGVEQDENGNLSFDPVKFAMGFLGGSGGSFALKKGFQILEKNPELKEKIINELADTLAQGFEKAREKYPLLSTLEPRYIVKNEKGRKIQAKTMLKELEREQKGLYNVAFNGKNASLIKKDLEAVDEAILFEKGTKRKGGKHIRLAHSTEPSQEGYVTKQEVANLGVNIREYLKNYEPFIDKNGARLYEWKDENGVKFRAVVNNTQTSGGNSHLPSASEEIITFYSDRNLKEKMNFKNPLLKDTIAESTMQGEALSKELEKSFLDESGRIAYKALIHKAEALPQSLNLKGFKQMIFNNDKTKRLNAENAHIKTPVGEVKVNVLRAFNHYFKQAPQGNKKENRQALNATFMPTLLEPKFVTRDEEGTMYYCKPFISKDKQYHITSIAVKKNGNLDYATSYNATENRLRQMIKHNKLVYKKD